jgi:diguanylate cyclase (GGDEF)-like protein
MKKILLGAAEDKWRKLLDHGSETEVVLLQCYDKREVSSCLNRCLIILDQTFFDSLNEAEQESIHRSHLVLLLDQKTPQKKVQGYSRAAMAIFYHRPGEKLDKATQKNFLVFLEGVEQIGTLANRLDSYIRDSFQDIVDTNLLLVQKKEIEELNKKLEELSRVDTLTHLLNRRALLEAFDVEKKRAERNRWRMQNEKEKKERVPVSGKFTDHIGNFACIMIDLDHFKHVNDDHGHLSGDAVLKAFGELVQESGMFRENDIIGRYGGEEFIILLPETNADNAMIPAERLRKAIKEVDFVDHQGDHFRVSIRVGISEYRPQEDGTDQMISRADKALYHSKETGRDKVTLYSLELEDSSDLKANDQVS